MRACARVALASIAVSASFSLSGCAAIEELKETFLRWIESEKLPSGRGVSADELPEATPLVPPEKTPKEPSKRHPRPREMDLFVVPTISFRLLYGFLILQHSRRELVWLGVTARPSAHWIARQLTEAYGWQQPPRYIVRDRDCVYGAVVIERLRAMGIRDRPICTAIAMAERIFGEAHRFNPTGLP